MESLEINTVVSSIDCISKIVEDLRINSENYSFTEHTKG